MRSLIHWQVTLCLLSALSAVTPVGAEATGSAPVASRSQGVIAAGTADETTYFVFDSGVPGPAVLVVGGVHGDEPAGYTAAGQIRFWSVVRGKLVVLPRANVKGIAAGKRLTPGLSSALSNLNRNFPKHDQPNAPDAVRGDFAKAVWTFIEQQRFDWVIDLHEGFDFRVATDKSVGSSVIRTPSDEADAVAAKMLDRVNATITNAGRRFVRLGPPIDGSLARAAAVHAGAESMILETTSKGATLPVRVRQHRLMVHTLLTHLHMTNHGPDVVNDHRPADARAVEQKPGSETNSGDQEATRKRYIALFNDSGVGGNGPAAIKRHLAQFPDLDVTEISAADVRAGVLSAFDVVVFPGGSGSGQAKAIGEAGRENVRQFVQRGGGYVGICAGSYLAASNYSWSLKIIDAHTVDTKHWARGKGDVKIELTDAGLGILGPANPKVAADDDLLNVLYANGPILAASNLPELPDAQPLAIFRSDMAKNGAPTGVMPGTAAALAADFGKGRVVCFSPHPEQTAGLEPLVRRAIEWSARSGEPVSSHKSNSQQ